MDLLGYRAFTTELLKIATEVRDADIRAMIAEGKGKEYGSQLRTNSQTETNFQPKIAGFAGRLFKGKDYDQHKHKSLEQNEYELAVEEWENGGRRGPKPQSSEFLYSPKIAGFMGYTPPSAYNWRGKPPTGKSSPYETASNFAATGLKGGMTGAGAATLAHTLRHGHELKMAPGHLGMAVAGGAGIALADRALRRHAIIKQQKMHKMAMLGSQTFTPARALQTSQQQGHFENKLHRGVVTPMPGMVGKGA